jgi:hypothetical protein
MGQWIIFMQGFYFDKNLGIRLHQSVLVQSGDFGGSLARK